MMPDFVMEHYQIEGPYRSVSMERGAMSAQGELDIELQMCCVVNLDIRGEVGTEYLLFTFMKIP
jgi:hypothetical protein